MKNWTLDQLTAKGVKFTVYGGLAGQKTFPGVVAHPPVPEKRANKYGAVKCERHGRVYHSIAEADRADQLILLERAHVIGGLGFQPVFALHGAEGKRACKFILDFAYYEAGRHIVEDTKGVQTPTFRLKARLFLQQYPEYELRLSDGKGNVRPFRLREPSKKRAA